MVRKVFGIVVLVVLATYIINLRSENQELRNNLAELSEERVSLKDELSKIVDNDVKQYVNLPESQQKFDKANEILGKMILVFLANLELRMSDKQVTFAESAVSKPAPAVIPEKKEEVDTSDDKTIPVSVGITDPTGSAEVGVIGDLTAKTFAEEKEFLDKVARKDLYLDLRKTSSLFKGIEKSYPFLLGSFQGEIYHLKSKKKWPTTMDIELHSDGNRYQHIIEIHFPNGGRMSTRGTRDADKLYSKIQGDSSNGIILEISDKKYLQLFYNRASNSLTGNYYELSSKNFERQGIVRLDKH